MPTVKSFNDLDSFFEQEAIARKRADQNTRAEQVLQPGEFFIRQFEDVTIYGEVLDAAASLLNGRNVADLDDEELEEYNDTLDAYRSEHLRFYRFTRGFSKVCPDGELGDTHLSTVTRKITAEEFMVAKEAGWP